MRRKIETGGGDLEATLRGVLELMGWQAQLVRSAIRLARKERVARRGRTKRPPAGKARRCP